MAKMGILKNVQSRTGTQDNRSVALTVKDIPVGDIEVKENVRKEYTGLEDLMESIKRYGLLQPITVYAMGDGYVVKFGNRRFLAYQRLYKEDPERFHSIRCIISDSQNTALVQLVENVQRVDLSQHDLYQALNQLREQGMTLRQIGEIIGKTEGHIKNLFMGVNEVAKDDSLKELISHSRVTIQEIMETKGIPNRQERIELLEQRGKGEITRAEMREKVQELSGPTPKNGTVQTPKENGKTRKTHIIIKAFPDLSKIYIYLVKGANAEQLKLLENDLRSYFSTNKDKYHIEKAKP